MKLQRNDLEKLLDLLLLDELKLEQLLDDRLQLLKLLRYVCTERTRHSDRAELLRERLLARKAAQAATNPWAPQCAA